MTNGNKRNYWDDERLNQLTALAAANTAGIAQLREQQKATTAYIQSLGEQQKATTAYIQSLGEQQEATTAYIQSLGEQQEATTAYIQSLGEQQETTNTNIDILTGFINGQEQHIATILQEIRDIKADIRGLQLENRRMLEELRSRRDNGG